MRLLQCGYGSVGGAADGFSKRIKGWARRKVLKRAPTFKCSATLGLRLRIGPT